MYDTFREVVSRKCFTGNDVWSHIICSLRIRMWYTKPFELWKSDSIKVSKEIKKCSENPDAAAQLTCVWYMFLEIIIVSEKKIKF